MNLKRHVPADEPLVSALRIGPRLLFLGGCFLAVVTLMSDSVVGGLEIGQVGAGAFSLGFAVVAGNRLAAERYLGAVLSLIVAVVVGTGTVGVLSLMTGTVAPSTTPEPIPLIESTLMIQVMMAVTVIWVTIRYILGVGMPEADDPNKETEYYQEI